MQGRRNPPLDFASPDEGTPVTFDGMALAYLQDYQLQRYRSLNTARAASSTSGVISADG
jgi:hypothetical protein